MAAQDSSIMTRGSDLESLEPLAVRVRGRLADPDHRIKGLEPYEVSDDCESRLSMPAGVTVLSLIPLASITGTAGSDFIHRSGDGLVAPVGFNDLLGVTTGDDSLFGGDGDDIIHGDKGSDRLDGG